MATTGSRPARRSRASAGGHVSLERALSKLGFASRSEAHALIRARRVTVNGEVISDPARRVIPEQVAIAIAIDGQAPARQTGTIVIALHKPRGYVSTRSDPDGRQTIFDLLATLAHRVVPVGRLDLATSGLLLLTNHTQLANWLTDPDNAIPRVYLATVEGRISGDDLVTLERGVVHRGERLRAAAAALRKTSNRESHLTVTLTEGKNREVRRLVEAIGHPVTRLRRVQFGGLALGNLPPGQWRRIDEPEFRAAFPHCPFACSPRERQPRHRPERKRVPRPK